MYILLGAQQRSVTEKNVNGVPCVISFSVQRLPLLEHSVSLSVAVCS